MFPWMVGNMGTLNVYFGFFDAKISVPPRRVCCFHKWEGSWCICLALIVPEGEKADGMFGTQRPDSSAFSRNPLLSCFLKWSHGTGQGSDGKSANVNIGPR